MMVIGVTGGLASGKSTIAKMMSAAGLRHVDADKLVHSLMSSDSGTIALLAKSFPSAVSKNKVDRAKLAEAITKKPASLAKLEAILHPRVRALEEEAIIAAHKAKAKAIILDIPLLFETDAHELCDVVVVAHAPKALRRKRAFARPGMTEEKWRRLLDRQLPDAARLKHADHVISTSTSLAETRRSVKKLLREWKLL